MQPQTQTHTTCVTLTLTLPAVKSGLSEGIVIIEDMMPNHISHDNLESDCTETIPNSQTHSILVDTSVLAHYVCIIYIRLMIKLWIQLKPRILQTCLRRKISGFSMFLSLRTPQLTGGSLICRGGGVSLGY